MKLEEVSTYEDAVSYCMEIPRFFGKSDFSRTRRFFSYLGYPGEGSRVVHVAGTNGKGSVCAFLDSIFCAAGKKTARFTSPHLTDIRERICINQEWISRKDFFKAFDYIRASLIRIRTQEGMEDYHPSFFEFIFFLAMVYFEEQRPEVILLETGLGGRLDTTNVVRKKDLCVITKIGYDHMEYLGNTLCDIASEKAGILREDVPVICLDNRKETTDVILKKAKELGCLCRLVSRECANLISFTDKDIDFSYKSRYYENTGIKIHTRARYQIENALLALYAAEELCAKEEICVQTLKKGIYNMHWEGRMEEILPGVFMDGAHNEDGIAALLETAGQDGCKGHRYLLFSAVADKRYDAMASMIIESALFDAVYITEMNTKRGLSIQRLRELFGSAKELAVFSDAADAFCQLKQRKKDTDYIYVAGSLYLIGQLKEMS